MNDLPSNLTVHARQVAHRPKRTLTRVVNPAPTPAAATVRTVDPNLPRRLSLVSSGPGTVEHRPTVRSAGPMVVVVCSCGELAVLVTRQDAASVWDHHHWKFAVAARRPTGPQAQRQVTGPKV